MDMNVIQKCACCNMYVTAAVVIYCYYSVFNDQVLHRRSFVGALYCLIANTLVTILLLWTSIYLFILHV